MVNKTLRWFCCYITIIGLVYSDSPSWTVDESDYTGNASLAGVLFLNDVLQAEENVIGAFVNDSCRGVATPENYEDNWLYFLTIYGNANGDTVTFKAWIADTDTILDIWETVIYEYNSVVGDPDNPIQLNSYLNFDFHPIVVDIPDQVVEIGTAFENINLNNYLTSIDGQPIIWETDGSNTNFIVQIENDIASVEPMIDTWVGSESVIFIATEDTENGYADSDTVLFEILPLDHAPLLGDIPDQTIGIYGYFLDIALFDYLTEVDGDSLNWSVLFSEPAETDNDPSWSVNPAEFEFNMSATIMVESNDVIAAGSESLLSAFTSDGSIVGVTTPVENGDEWIFPLTIYSNTNVDTISFRFYDAGILQNLPILENLNFSTNDIYGSPDNPIIFHAGNILVNLDSDGVASFELVDELWTGTENISFIVEDLGTLNSYTDSDEVSFIVIQDYAPVISGIPDQSVEVGTAFSSFDLIDFVQVYDGDEVAYNISGAEDLEVNFSGSTVTVVPLDNEWIGSNLIIFTVTDNTENSFTTSDTAAFEILSLDDSPVISEIIDQVIEIGQEFESIDLTSYLTELDGDSVAWRFEFLHSEIPTEEPDWTIDASQYENSMTVTAQIRSLGNPAIGPDHILAAISEDGSVLGVSNGIEYLDDWLYFLTIYSDSSVEDVGLLFFDSEHQRILPILEDLTFGVNVTYGSPDEPYQVHAGPTLVFIDSTNHIQFQTIDPIWQYPEIIRITVQDQGTVFSYSSSQDVLLMMDNDSPTVSLNSPTIDEGSQFNPIDLRSVIMDNWSPYDSLSISIYDQNLFVVEVINDTLFLSIEDSNWFGENIITFEIGDHHPYNPMVREIEIPFVVNNINDVPVITDIVDQMIDEDASLVLSLAGDDLEGDSLSFTAEIILGEIVAEIEGDTLTVLPLANWNGSGLVQVTINDQNGGYDTTQFNVVVNPVNDPPMSIMDTVSGSEDEVLSIMLSGSDVDTDDESLIFSLAAPPSHGILEMDEASFSYNPELNWYGLDSFKYLIYDGYLYSDTGTVSIEILSINDVPVAKLMNNEMTSMQSQRIIIDGSMSYDTDNDSLSYTWEIDELFSIESEENAQIILNTPVLESESIFQIILTVSDGLLISLPDTLLLTVLDLTPNDILPSFTGTEINIGESILISVEIPDFFIVDSISLHYSNSVNDFISVDMIEANTRSSAYVATIDSSMVGIEGLAYYVFAQSTTDNIIQTDTTNIQVSIASNTIFSTMENSTLQNGLLKSKWMNISIPSELTDNSISSIFHNALDGEPNDSEWMLYEWNNTQWVEPDNVVSGKGYWIKQIIHDRIDFSLGEGITSKLSGFTIDLDSGWNLISSPYLFPVSIPSYSDQLSEIYYYDGGGWVDSTITHLLPWGGYAIFNYSETPQILTLSPLDENSGNNIAFVNNSGWTSTMSVKADGYSDHKNLFGIHEESRNSFDLIDCPEPPTLDQYVSFYSMSQNNKNPYKRLTKDFRNLSKDSLQVWDLVLESTIKDFEGELKVKVDGELLGYELWFLDVQNRDFFQLKLDTPHFLNIKKRNPHTMYYYKLIYGSSENVHQYFQTVLPQKYSLHNNYPNPFNPVTTIPFDIPNSSGVIISIYDVGGRKVKKITDQNWPAGYHELQWNGRNSNGEMVGTGVYFIRMQSDKFIQYKKMIFLK